MGYFSLLWIILIVHGSLIVASPLKIKRDTSSSNSNEHIEDIVKLEKSKLVKRQSNYYNDDESCDCGEDDIFRPYTNAFWDKHLNYYSPGTYQNPHSSRRFHSSMDQYNSGYNHHSNVFSSNRHNPKVIVLKPDSPESKLTKVTLKRPLSEILKLDNPFSDIISEVEDNPREKDSFPEESYETHQSNDQNNYSNNLLKQVMKIVNYVQKKQNKKVDKIEDTKEKEVKSPNESKTLNKNNKDHSLLDQDPIDAVIKDIIGDYGVIHKESSKINNEKNVKIISSKSKQNDSSEESDESKSSEENSNEAESDSNKKNNLDEVRNTKISKPTFDKMKEKQPQTPPLYSIPHGDYSNPTVGDKQTKQTISSNSHDSKSKYPNVGDKKQTHDHHPNSGTDVVKKTQYSKPHDEHPFPRTEVVEKKPNPSPHDNDPSPHDNDPSLHIGDVVQTPHFRSHDGYIVEQTLHSKPIEHPFIAEIEKPLFLNPHDDHLTHLGGVEQTKTDDHSAIHMHQLHGNSKDSEQFAGIQSGISDNGHRSEEDSHIDHEDSSPEISTDFENPSKAAITPRKTSQPTVIEAPRVLIEKLVLVNGPHLQHLPSADGSKALSHEYQEPLHQLSTELINSIIRIVSLAQNGNISAIDNKIDKVEPIVKDPLEIVVENDQADTVKGVVVEKLDDSLKYDVQSKEETEHEAEEQHITKVEEVIDDINKDKIKAHVVEPKVELDNEVTVVEDKTVPVSDVVQTKNLVEQVKPFSENTTNVDESIKVEGHQDRSRTIETLEEGSKTIEDYRQGSGLKSVETVEEHQKSSKPIQTLEKHQEVSDITETLEELEETSKPVQIPKAKELWKSVEILEEDQESSKAIQTTDNQEGSGLEVTQTVEEHQKGSKLVESPEESLESSKKIGTLETLEEHQGESKPVKMVEVHQKDSKIAETLEKQQEGSKAIETLEEYEEGSGYKTEEKGPNDVSKPNEILNHNIILEQTVKINSSGLGDNEAVKSGGDELNSKTVQYSETVINDSTIEGNKVGSFIEPLEGVVSEVVETTGQDLSSGSEAIHTTSGKPGETIKSEEKHNDLVKGDTLQESSAGLKVISVVKEPITDDKAVSKSKIANVSKVDVEGGEEIKSKSVGAKEDTVVTPLEKNLSILPTMTKTISYVVESVENTIDESGQVTPVPTGGSKQITSDSVGVKGDAAFIPLEVNGSTLTPITKTNSNIFESNQSRKVPQSISTISDTVEDDNSVGKTMGPGIIVLQVIDEPFNNSQENSSSTTSDEKLESISKGAEKPKDIPNSGLAGTKGVLELKSNIISETPVAVAVQGTGESISSFKNVQGQSKDEVSSSVGSQISLESKGVENSVGSSINPSVETISKVENGGITETLASNPFEEVKIKTIDDLIDYEFNKKKDKYAFVQDVLDEIDEKLNSKSTTIKTTDILEQTSNTKSNRIDLSEGLQDLPPVEELDTSDTSTVSKNVDAMDKNIESIFGSKSFKLKTFNIKQSSTEETLTGAGDDIDPLNNDLGSLSDYIDVRETSISTSTRKSSALPIDDMETASSDKAPYISGDHIDKTSKWESATHEDVTESMLPSESITNFQRSPPPISLKANEEETNPNVLERNDIEEQILPSNFDNWNFPKMFYRKNYQNDEVEKINKNNFAGLIPERNIPKKSLKDEVATHPDKGNFDKTVDISSRIEENKEYVKPTLRLMNILEEGLKPLKTSQPLIEKLSDSTEILEKILPKEIEQIKATFLPSLKTDKSVVKHLLPLNSAEELDLHYEDEASIATSTQSYEESKESLEATSNIPETITSNKHEMPHNSDHIQTSISSSKDILVPLPKTLEKPLLLPLDKTFHASNVLQRTENKNVLPIEIVKEENNTVPESIPRVNASTSLKPEIDVLSVILPEKLPIVESTRKSDLKVINKAGLRSDEEIKKEDIKNMKTHNDQDLEMFNKILPKYPFLGESQVINTPKKSFDKHKNDSLNFNFSIKQNKDASNVESKVENPLKVNFGVEPGLLLNSKGEKYQSNENDSKSIKHQDDNDEVPVASEHFHSQLPPPPNMPYFNKLNNFENKNKHHNVNHFLESKSKDASKDILGLSDQSSRIETTFLSTPKYDDVYSDIHYDSLNKLSPTDLWEAFLAGFSHGQIIDKFPKSESDELLPQPELPKLVRPQSSAFITQSHDHSLVQKTKRDSVENKPENHHWFDDYDAPVTPSSISHDQHRIFKRSISETSADQTKRSIKNYELCSTGNHKASHISKDFLTTEVLNDDPIVEYVSAHYTTEAPAPEVEDSFDESHEEYIKKYKKKLEPFLKKFPAFIETKTE